MEQNRALESGRELCDIQDISTPVLERVPAFLVGKPIKDYDATNGEIPAPDTFLVLSRRRWGEQFDHAFRFNQAKSLWLMRPHNPIRLTAIRIITNAYFYLFIVMVIIANCVILALHDSQEKRWVRYTEQAFTAIYTIEMLLKIVAMGFVLHRYAYLRDPWNRLDLLVVIIGLFSFIEESSWVNAIRAFRVLRAVKVISAVKGLRTAVNMLLESIVMLGNVFFLFTFFLATIALVGLELFKGDLRNKCVENVSGTLHDFETNKSYWYLKNGKPMLCSNDTFQSMCRDNTSCRQVGPNPDDGYTGFDNIGLAFLMAFQLLTLDFWENQYNKILRVKGPWYILFYIPVISFGSFFLYNLILAVVTIAFTKESQDVARVKKRRLRLKRTEPSYNVDNETLQNLHLLKTDPHTEKLLRLKRRRRQQKQTKQGIRVAARRSGSKTNLDIRRQPENTERATRPVRYRLWFYRVVTHDRFEWAVIGLILVNAVVLACYHYPMDPKLKSALDIVNQVFTWLFLLEMLCKLVALGPRLYVKDRWNIVDGVVVVVSVLDSIFQLTYGENNPLKIIGSGGLRSLRLFRVLRLAKVWKEMGMVLGTFAKSIGELASISVLLLLVIFIFAVLGMQLFGRWYTKSVFKARAIPRWNFKDFWHSYMMVFRIICGEWIEPLWTCMWAVSEWVVLFFLPAFIIGNLIVLNLFLALLLDSFQNFHEERKQENRQGKKAFVGKLLKKLKTRNNEELTITKKKTTEEIDPYDLPTSTPTSPERESSSSTQTASVTASDSEMEVKVEKIPDCMPSCCPLPSRCKTRNKKWLTFRYRIRSLVEHKYFEWAILVLIFVSSFVLVWEDHYLKCHPQRQIILTVLDYVFCVAFGIEMLLKITGFGLSKYFASAWNWLDAFIVCISVASFSINLSPAYRSLRTLRALRPLRALSRLQGMKVTINALFASISGIANVLLVCLVFWVIFSILGVQLFKGKFYKCQDSSGQQLAASIVQNKSVCYSKNYTWTNSKVNFDNVARGFLALFQVATFEGWMEVMKDAVDAKGIDQQPEAEYNPWAYIYFFIFIVLGTFVVFNLFISVIIDNFHKLKSEYDDDIGMFLTENQRKWVALLREAVKMKPKVTFKKRRPKGWFCGQVFDIVKSDKFEIVILGIITLNVILMMLEHYGQSQQMTLALLGLNIIFTSVYLLEAIVKLCVMRLRYFRSRWNVYDFVILIASIAGVAAEIVFLKKQNPYPNPSFLRILRIFRIARLFKFLERGKGVRKLIVALVISLPSIFNVGMLIFIIVFIYAIIGMSLFRDITPRGNLDNMMNFRDFWSSLLLLFRLTTSAGWNDVLDSLSEDCKSSCSTHPRSSCTGKLTAALYLVSYVLIIFLIMVNMFIAILLESVNAVYKEDEFVIGEATLANFYDVWSSFAPRGEAFIPYNKLSDFAAKLSKPLRIPQPNDMKIFRMRIPYRRGDQVHVFDVMKAMVKHCLHKENQLESSEEFDEIVAKMEIKFYRYKKQIINFTGEKRPSSKEAAALVIQKAYRIHLRRKRLKDIVDAATRLTNAFVYPLDFPLNEKKKSNSCHGDKENTEQNFENLEMTAAKAQASNLFVNDLEMDTHL